MRKVFLFIGFFMLVAAAKAQPYISHNGMFQVDQIRGCAPFTINITATNLDGSHACTSGASGTPCVMSFDGTNSCPPNASCQNVLQFTYTTPKTYRLQVIYQGGIADYIDVTVDQNIQPDFDIYSCAGSKVEINITDRNYDSYDINFNSETGPAIDKTISASGNQVATFSYGAVGSHNITVQGKKTNAANNCNLKSKPFNAITSLPVPTINSLTAKSIDSLVLGFTPITNIDYKSEIAINSSTNFQGYPIQYGVNSLTIPNVNVNNNYYCLRLNSFDPCANQNKYSLYPICSQRLSAGVASGVNQLSWITSSQNVKTIDIKRDNNVIKTIPGTNASYSDYAVQCKLKYQYQLVSKYINGETSTSLTTDPVTAILFQTPSAINNTSAIVDDPKVDLVWLQDPAYTASSYGVLRGPKGGPFHVIGTASSPSFSDPSFNNAGYCYQINYADNCGNFSDKGLPVCPMVLSASLEPSNDVTLDWTSYEGWNSGVKGYKLLRYYQPGETPFVIQAGLSTTLTDQPDSKKQVVYYKVEATPVEPGVSSSRSGEIKVVRNINLYHPTAFNPESKISLDKTFSVKGHFITSIKLQIFDRWGSLVYYSDEGEPWDGKREGLPMPDATYVWTADGTDQAGNSFKKAGTVILIRK